MKNIFKQSKGFSMIELLVVVLIIGVLTAIIVPSYEKAGEKAKVAEAIAVLRGIEMDARTHIIENRGFYEFDSIEQITPALSAGELENIHGSSNKWVTKNWYFTADGSKQDNSYIWSIVAIRNTNDYGLEIWLTPGPNNVGITVEQHRCHHNSTDIGKYICKYLEPSGWKYTK